MFAVAGVAKLADRAGSRKAMLGFGVPARLAGPFGLLLPVTEIAVAAALIPTALAWWGALAAVTLLLLFAVGIAANLARGRRPDCHCFGQLYSAPIGWPTLARDGVLAAVAGFVVWQGSNGAGLSALGWLRSLTPLQVAGLIGGSGVLALLAAEGWFLLQLLRQQGRLLVRLDLLEAQLVAGGAVPAPTPAVAPRGLELGTPAPAFRLFALSGPMLSLDDLRAAGEQVLLIFSDPDCPSCTLLLPDIGRWQRDLAARLAVVVISRGAPAAQRAVSAEHGLTHVLLQKGREVAEAYQAARTPSAVIVRGDGTVGSPVAEGAEAIRTLVAGTVGQAHPLHSVTGHSTADCNRCPGKGHNNGNGSGNGNGNGHGLESALNLPVATVAGGRVPALELPDLDGTTVALADLRGSPTLLLFWNPECGFCQRMLNDLRAWENNAPPGAPKLVVVSTGTVEANRAMRLRSPVLLDREFSAARELGARGTPSAVLLDAEGAPSRLAVGASAILEIAWSKQGQTQPAMP
jgi:peroxiredoxin